MKNRIRHILNNWQPDLTSPTQQQAEVEIEPVADLRPDGSVTLPQGVNMLMPVELCIYRDLLVSLLSACIHEMQRHRRHVALQSPLDLAQLAALEVSLRQQLSLHSWARQHSANYIRIAMYPVARPGAADRLDGLDTL